MDRTQDFWNQQAEWSQSTFGTDKERGPLGPLKHLEKEAKEAQESAKIMFSPGSWHSLGLSAQADLRIEIADCLFLTFDAARRSGMTLTDLLDTAFQKLEINKKREWPKNLPLDSAVEHVRTPDVN